jgi:Fe-S-cluster containining protein
MTEFEWDRMVVAHGKIPLATVGTGDCPFLNAEKKCEHHDVRPGLCRLWGVVQAPPMECPHGCRPKRYLSDDEAFWIMKELDRIGGGITVKQLELIQ